MSKRKLRLPLITTDPANGCQFSNGENLVVIEDPVNVTDYDTLTVSFVGVTFTGFDGAAISGNAGASATVQLFNSNFEVSSSQLSIWDQVSHNVVRIS